MAKSKGESLKVDFNGSLKLEFHGSKVTSDSITRCSTSTSTAT